MKKIYITALCTLFLSKLVVAEDMASKLTGFYSGLALGVNKLGGKYNTDWNLYDGDENIDVEAHTYSIGTSSIDFSIIGGWGKLINRTYYGLEANAGYNTTNDDLVNFKDTDFNNDIQKIDVNLKRSFQVGIASRIGQMITDNIMLYGRLSLDWQWYKLRVTSDSVIDGFFTSDFTSTIKKSIPALVPGIGIETTISENWLFRGEATYSIALKKLYGAETATNAIIPGGTLKMNNAIRSLNNITVKMGLSYRF
jgi:hypothetical protein